MNATHAQKSERIGAMLPDLALTLLAPEAKDVGVGAKAAEVTGVAVKAEKALETGTELLARRAGRVLTSFADEALEGMARSERFANTLFRTAEEVNATFPPHWHPPYLPKSKVLEFTLKQEEVFVRVHEAGNKAGYWMAKLEDIEGLTAKQIQNKFALPAAPTYISEVHVPANTMLRAGRVNPGLMGRETPLQYEWIGTLETKSFKNTRLLNEN